MSRRKNISYNNQGFTLIELAIVLTIIGFMLAVLIMPLSAQRDLKDYEQTRRDLSEVREALVGFSLSQPNPHLPCPDINNDGDEDRAGSDCTMPIGTLPWATLGLGRADSWNNAYIYSVTAAFSDSGGFTLASNGNNRILDSAGGATVAAQVPVVIISKGKNGNGTQADEIENNTANAIFVSHEQIDLAANAFDDVVVWVPSAILFNRMVAAGRLP